MVGEPTTFTEGLVRRLPGRRRCDAAPRQARAIKTEQEIERMRLANEIAAAAMEHVQGVLRPGMTCAQAAAEWQGFVHGEGTGWKGQVELALPFSLVWSGPWIRTFTATTRRPLVEGEPTLFEIWVCADGYWADHTKNLCLGELKPRYGSSRQAHRRSTTTASRSAVPGAQPRRARPASARGHRAPASRPALHPICHGVGARAHEPPYAHQAGGGEIAEGMVLAIEPGVYWPEGGGLRLEDNFLVTAEGAEKLSSVPGRRQWRSRTARCRSSRGGRPHGACPWFSAPSCRPLRQRAKRPLPASRMICSQPLNRAGSCAIT